MVKELHDAEEKSEIDKTIFVQEKGRLRKRNKRSLLV